ncbi:MAG: hypothetical protein KDJ16_07065 [Hyphomicrobiales bacterium]|nr:hypothetical protein [Hyphomicrobiales bacterium]
MGKFARIRVLILGLALSGVGMTAAAADPLGEVVSALPVEITDIRLVGEWTRKMETADGEPAATETGLYRTIVVTDTANGGASRLFIQWLQNGEVGPTLIGTIEIPELAELNVVIYDFTYEADDEGLAVYLDTYEAATGAESGYELFLRSADDYIFQPISN